MKKNKTDTILENARRLRLSKYEKTHLKNEFISYMEANPVRGREQRTWASLVPSFHWIRSPAPYAATTLALLLIVGSGVTYAAQGALPGDFLYPVKVSVNEEVRGWFHSTPESYAIYEAHRANERLEEIEQLALSGRIDASNWSRLSANIDTHITNVKEYVSASEESGEIEKAHHVNTQLQSVLDVHDDVLKGVSEEMEERKQVLSAVIGKVTKQQKDTKTFDQRIAEALETSDSPQLRELATSTQQSVRGKLASLTKTLDAQSDKMETLSQDRSDPITSRLNRAESEYENGTTAYENELYGKAFVHFTRSYQLLEEITMLVKTEEKLSIRTDSDSDVATSTSQTDGVNATSSTSTSPQQPEEKEVATSTPVTPPVSTSTPDAPTEPRAPTSSPKTSSSTPIDWLQ